MNKFEHSLKHTLKSEGGNVDDPHDQGGRTSRGILSSEYNAYRDSKELPHRDVWEAADYEIHEIYLTKYWEKTQAELFSLPKAYMLFDFAVHSGVKTARVILQETVGVRADNVFGPITVAAIRAAPTVPLINYYTRRRWQYVKTRPSFPYFSAGWANRISACKQNALTLMETEHS